MGNSRLKSERRAPVPWLSAQDAKVEIDRLTAAIQNEPDRRNRTKLARRLAFAAPGLAFIDEELTTPDLEQGLAALPLARKSGGLIDDLNRAQARLSKKRLEASGCADAQILGEKKKNMAVSTATLTAAPDNISDDADFLAWRNEDLVAAMNDGRFFMVRFQGDDLYPITVRWIDAAEPVLKPDEYKYLEESSDVGFLRIGSGELRFGAPEDLAEAAVLKVPDGLALVRVFCIRNRDRSRIILVACAAAQPPAPLTELPHVEF